MSWKYFRVAYIEFKKCKQLYNHSNRILSKRNAKISISCLSTFYGCAFSLKRTRSFVNTKLNFIDIYTDVTLLRKHPYYRTGHLRVSIIYLHHIMVYTQYNWNLKSYPTKIGNNSQKTLNKHKSYRIFSRLTTPFKQTTVITANKKETC